MLFSSTILAQAAASQAVDLPSPNQRVFSNSNKTINVVAEQKKSTPKGSKEDYYDYEQYDTKDLVEDDQETDYTELNDHLLTKKDKSLNVDVFNGNNKIVESSVLPKVAHKLVKNAPTTLAPLSASTIISKKVLAPTQSTPNVSAKPLSNKAVGSDNDEEESYDYGQEDYYQLAASDLKTVKDGTISLTTLTSDGEDNSFNMNSTDVAPLKSSTQGPSDKLNDILKELITPTIRLVVTTTASTSATTSSTTAAATSEKIASKSSITNNIIKQDTQKQSNIFNSILEQTKAADPVSQIIIATTPTASLINPVTKTINPSATNKNEEYDEEYNYYYDDEENEENAKTAGTKAKTNNKKVKSTTSATQKAKLKVKPTPKPSSDTKLNKQAKLNINSLNVNNKNASIQETTYDDEYENYDEEYYDYDEDTDNDTSYADDTKKEDAKANAKLKESSKTNAQNDTEYYDEYYDDPYYGDEDDYENSDKKSSTVKPKIETLTTKTNKTKEFYDANYEEIDYVLNATQNKHTTTTTGSNLVISSLMTIEKLKTTMKPPVDEDKKSSDDVKGFYDTDIEWDTNETDYYDFNFTAKTSTATTAAAKTAWTSEVPLEEATTKSINTTSVFNLRELIRSPALLASMFGGVLVAVITASLLIFFICYRMKRRKYEENTYMINGTLKNARVHYPNPNRIYSRNNHQPHQHVTLLSSSSLSPVTNLSGAGSSTSSSNSATTGLLNGNTMTSTRLLKYTNPAQTLRKTTSNLSSDSGSSPNHDGAFNYAYIKAPTKEFYA